MDKRIIIGVRDGAPAKFSSNGQCQNEHQNELNITQQKAPIGKLPNNSKVKDNQIKELSGEGIQVQFLGNSQSHQFHDIEDNGSLDQVHTTEIPSSTFRVGLNLCFCII